MSKAIFIQNPVSIYKDRPGEAYHFPKRYLRAVQETVGDWVIFYESRNNNGAFGYVSVQRVLDVVPDLQAPDHYYAILDPSSEWSFEHTVPRAAPDGIAFELSLRGEDGRPMSGGANVSAVRRISNQEFAAIVNYGMQELTGPEAMPRNTSDDETAPLAFNESPAPFDHAPLADFRPEILTSRKYRDPSFQRQVRKAYGGRCAISGLELRNGGGRPEVEAAHIRPVKDKGPDTVRNGLALSGTLHWMFDRGLISVAEDHHILISHNKVPKETAARLISPGQKLLLPENPRHHPHPEYLRYHRENIYGQSC